MCEENCTGFCKGKVVRQANVQFFWLYHIIHIIYEGRKAGVNELVCVSCQSTSGSNTNQRATIPLILASNGNGDWRLLSGSTEGMASGGELADQRGMESTFATGGRVPKGSMTFLKYYGTGWRLCCKVDKIRQYK